MYDNLTKTDPMKRQIFPMLALLLAASLLTACGGGENRPRNYDRASIVSNPIDLNYRFQRGDPDRIFTPDQISRREAADPVLEYYKGKYYLFASKSGGYWSSTDLRTWDFIPCTSIATIEAYAPTVVVWRDTLYYMGSGQPRIFRTANPDEDRWEEIETKLIYPGTDFAFFRDDDERMFLYWGCSNVDPIVGVEVDPTDGFRALGTPDTLILHNHEQYGWEEPDKGKRKGKAGYNEGPCITKYKGKYYLQYAAPGTEFRIYGDGVYVGDSPLGPFTYEQNSPYSFKPGGFIAGAGHGHTFLDKYGNYWHVATMTISVRHMFERRLVLLPVWFGADDRMYAHSAMADYPVSIPDRKVDFATDDRWTGWNHLAYRKAVTASSETPGYEAALAVDERVETWWAAASGDPGEWLQIDLGRQMRVEAVQINFADHLFANSPEQSYVNYRYHIESSADALGWEPLIDRRENLRDAPHELVVLPRGVTTRYLRITNDKAMEGRFSLSGLRVFGEGLGTAPAAVQNLAAGRNPDDRCQINLTWDAQSDADGYILRWGLSPEQMHSAIMVYENRYAARIFNAGPGYYFAVDAFNDSGITRAVGTVAVE